MPRNITPASYNILSERYDSEAKPTGTASGIFYIRTDMKVDEKQRQTRRDREARFIERLTAKVTGLSGNMGDRGLNDLEAHGQGARSKNRQPRRKIILRPRSPAPSMSSPFHGALDRSCFRPARSYRPDSTLRLTAGNSSITFHHSSGDIHRPVPVDSYLSSATQGLFVGVGIVVLLWTISSLLSYIEDVSQHHLARGKAATGAFSRKITDYIAICLIIPILMICFRSGVSIFMSTVIQTTYIYPFLTPMINNLLNSSPGTDMAGVHLVLLPDSQHQGAVQVCRYLRNHHSDRIPCAPGTFPQRTDLRLQIQRHLRFVRFLPLLLVWLQLSWLMLLAGCVLTFSMQNVYTFNLMGTPTKSPSIPGTASP